MSRGFVPRVVAYYATRDLIPLYQVYALLFADHGLSAGEISSLFILWSVASFLVEVPSGAWADAVDRRLLLVASAAVYAAAFGTWLLWPSYPGFALGFLLWGLSSAMMSGTFEALLYDELAAASAEERFTQVLGWCRSSALAAVLVSGALCAPLFAWGGYGLVGWASVGVVVVHGVLAWRLPAAPRVGSAAEDWAAGPGAFWPRYLALLRAGVHEATGRPRVRHAVLVSAALLGLMAYDEYFPLVARESGVATVLVPLLVSVSVAGEIVGSAVAGRFARISSRTAGWLVAVAAVAISLGAASGHPAGFAGIAVGYGLVNLLCVVSESRLQEVITGPARATVTSVAGVASEAGAVAMFAVVLVGSGWWSIATMLAVCGIPMLGLALVTARWLPDPEGEQRQGRRRAATRTG